MIKNFTDEQARQLIDLAQHYEVWLEAERDLRALSHRLAWKTIAGKEYLYRIRDRVGNGTSLGPRSVETERQHAEFVVRKDAAIARRAASKAILDQTCKICRALGLPQIAPEAAEIAREADIRGHLGKRLLVCGTTALAAYEVEAGGFIVAAPKSTRDFDVAHLADARSGVEPILMPILKAVDATYVTNSERTSQARNADAYEVESMAAPSVARYLARTETPMPIPLPEQEWLLAGDRVSRVVIARDGTPARLVVPDPRWYALQKMWLSRQAKRDSLKRDKDAAQAVAVLDVVVEAMPRFPLDGEFEANLPDDLRPLYATWQTRRPAPKPPAW
jgi:hypothetical protein